MNTFLYTPLLCLGRSGQETHQYPDAIRSFKGASKLRPADPEPHRSLAESICSLAKDPKTAPDQQQADRLSEGGKNQAVKKIACGWVSQLGDARFQNE
jgi:cytochrome c-type biogenesis protein CcmH/NrfG